MFQQRFLGLMTMAVAVAVLSASGALAVTGAPDFLASWGGLGRAPGALNGPDNVAVDLRGDVYVADRDNNRIEKFSATGVPLAVIGRNGGDGDPGTGAGEFAHPRGVATDGLGDLYVADSGNDRIQKFSPGGRFITMWGRAGLTAGTFNDPRGLATDRGGNVYVADHGNNRIQKFAPDGHFIARWGRNGGDGSPGIGNGEFRLPRGVAVDAVGDVFVADKDNNRVQEFSSGGRFIRRWGRNGGDATAGSGDGELRIPYSVAVDRSGRVYVADRGNNRIQVFTSTGTFVARWGRNGGDGTAGVGAGEFNGPYGVAVDCRGNVYVSDEGNNRIQKFGDPAGRAPACAPVLTLAHLPVRLRGGRVRMAAACDVACRATVTASIWIGRHFLGRPRGTSRRLTGGRPVQLSLAIPAGARRRLDRALQSGATPVLRVQASANGFGGRAPVMHLRRNLSR